MERAQAVHIIRPFTLPNGNMHLSQPPSPDDGNPMLMHQDNGHNTTDRGEAGKPITDQGGSTMLQPCGGKKRVQILGMRIFGNGKARMDMQVDFIISHGTALIVQHCQPRGTRDCGLSHVHANLDI